MSEFKMRSSLGSETLSDSAVGFTERGERVRNPFGPRNEGKSRRYQRQNAGLANLTYIT